jgi:hypothetical protein
VCRWSKCSFSKSRVILGFFRIFLFDIITKHNLRLEVYIFPILSIVLRTENCITLRFFKRRIGVCLMRVSPVSTISHKATISLFICSFSDNSLAIEFIILSLFSSLLLLSHWDKVFHVLFDLKRSHLAKWNIFWHLLTEKGFLACINSA